MQITVDGCNFFHTGWMACFLQLPRKHPGHNALKEGDVQAFQEGWDTCNETPIKDRYCAFLRMKQMYQMSSQWIDDQGEDVTVEG